MVTLKPFAALRPRAELAQQIASVPYDVINREEAKPLDRYLERLKAHFHQSIRREHS